MRTPETEKTQKENIEDYWDIGIKPIPADEIIAEVFVKYFLPKYLPEYLKQKEKKL